MNSTLILQILISGPESEAVKELSSFNQPKCELFLDLLYEHFEKKEIAEAELVDFLKTLDGHDSGELLRQKRSGAMGIIAMMGFDSSQLVFVCITTENIYGYIGNANSGI